MTDVDPVEFESQYLCTCLCGQEVHTVDNEEDVPALLHIAPVCEKFLELEPDEFLTYVRRGMGLPEPTDDDRSPS